MASTVERGGRAESRAVEELVRRGYRIVERNYRCFAGELDVIARDGDVLCFVEVRSRASAEHGHAAETVGRTKQRQVARVAQVYLAERRPQFEEARFDVVALTGGEVMVIPDAWRM